MSALTTWLLDVAPTEPGELRLVEELGPRGRRRAIIGTALATVLLAAAAVWAVRRFQQKGQFAPELWRPFKQWAIWKFLLLGLGNTLKAAAIAFALAITIGIAMAMWRSSTSRSVRRAATVYTEGFRACALVLLIRFFFFQYPKWFHGMTLKQAAITSLVTGLTLYYSTVLADVVRSGIRSVAKGQTEAGLTIGLTERQTLRMIVLPQALRRALPNLVTQSASLLKDTSLGVFVTYEELLSRAKITGEFGANVLQTFLVAGAMYVAVVAVLTTVANRLQRRQQTA